jgi:DNA polymerase III epsilon subunit-like protein
MDSRFVLVDLETAGVNPARHPIIQIAAIAVDESLDVIEAFEAKILFDEKQATRQSLRKCHYHPGLWARDARKAPSVGHEFADFLRRHATLNVTSARGDQYQVAQLVAHNSAFDGPFLQTWYDKLSIFLPAHRLTLCTMQRAMWYFAERPELRPPANFKLATLCRHFGVPFHAADAHDGLGDTLATLGLYRAMRQSARSSEEISASTTIRQLAAGHAIGENSPAGQSAWDR